MNKTTNKLSVIIPFLNEGDEIEKTLQGIRQTASDEVEVLLINDASYDGFDYQTVAQKYDAVYLCNEKRLGVAASRDLGIDYIGTDHFLIIDGHMRFYNNNWWKVVTTAIEKNARALYCCKCVAIDEKEQLIAVPPSYGAFLRLYDRSSLSVLQPDWCRLNYLPTQDIVPIPCLLGACYAGHVDYWKYLKGLKGLRSYGSDEPYISLKVWLEGGDCMLIKSVEIAHIFRNAFPYSVKHVDRVYNQLLIAETLLPGEHRDAIYNLLRKKEKTYLRDAMEMIADNREMVAELYSYYQSITNRTFESFVCFNEVFFK